MSDVTAAEPVLKTGRPDRFGPGFILGLCTLILAGAVCFQASVFYVQSSTDRENSEKWAENSGKQMAEALAHRLAEVAAIAAKLANDVGREIAGEGEGQPCNQCRACAGCDMASIVQSAYLNNTGFKSLGIAFGAFKSNPDVRLFAPFIQEHHVSKGKLQRIDHYYDYLSTAGSKLGPAPSAADETSNLASAAATAIDEGWYQQALASPPQWMPPRFEASVANYVIRHTVPMHAAAGDRPDTPASSHSQLQANGRQEIGVAFVDIDLEWLREHLEQWNVGDNNYVVLFNELDQVIYHSLRGRQKIVSDLRSGVSECSVADARQSPANPGTDCRLIAMKNARGEVGYSQLTGDRSWFHSHAIAATGWRLLTVIAANSTQESPAHSDRLFHWTDNRDRVAWVFWVVCTLVSGFAFYRVKRQSASRKQLWIDSFIYTQIFLFGIAGIWIWEHGAVDSSTETTRILSNQAMVNQFQEDYALARLRAHESPPRFVPVGLFVQSIEFVSATNVTLTGYIWHRYIEGQEIAVTDGTIFPEAIATNIRKSYEETVDGEVIKGWYFETTLRERFDPGKFPFDRQAVWVRLWHENIGENIVLVPDFKAYDNLSTRALPGVEREFVLSGWSLFRSFFDMRGNSYNTSLGRSGFASGEELPELYFNIEVKRNFLNPFISHFFPLFVVLLMLYAVLLTISQDENRKEVFGFNVSRVAASCSALFFVVLIAHVQLRRELAANSIVYLEYFYLISYVIIILITANAVLFSWRAPVRFILFHDNLLPKLIYWPALLGGFFIATAMVFISG